MDGDDVVDLLRTLRRIGGEPDEVEVKSGAGGFPMSVRESLVAFANTNGGMILIGVDERNGFAVVPIDGITKYRDTLVGLARDSVTPPLQLDTEIVEVENNLVLVAEVAPLPSDQRPAYVTAKGVTTGAYLRSGDGDRRMAEGEIALVYSARTQPANDRELVPGSSTEDLDWAAVRRSIQRVQAGSAKLRIDDEYLVLYRLGVLAEPHPNSELTLAGLLTFGEFPQQFFPQLFVSVAVHPSEADADTRFLDNVTVRGPIPDMVAETTSVLRRNLTARATIEEAARTERLDFPVDAIREAVVNALMHRDYSQVTRGTQVQVDLYPDRLVVRSPGGLYGGLIEDDLGEVGISSSRNSVLASLLSDAFIPQSEGLVAENRATGIPTMIRAARMNGLPRPTFRSSVLSFTVTMGRSALLGPDVQAWLRALAVDLPSPTHEVALAMMRGGYTTNAALREWGVDRVTATRVLRDLVDKGLAVREGGRRYARYVLDPSARGGRRENAQTAWSAPRPVMARTGVEQALRTAGVSTTPELMTATGLSRSTIQGRLNVLIAQGVVEPEGAPRSPKRRYRWVGAAAQGKGQA